MTKKSSKAKAASFAAILGEDEAPGGDFMWVDPARIRFQHARIRPYFSGCGRSVMETLESIRQGEISSSDLPPIQVIVGPVGSDGLPWYFSLNNRRLWVLKRCREEGLLDKTDHKIRVRVRKPKSKAEEQRYTLENCSLEAKIMREPSSTSKKSKSSTAQMPNPMEDAVEEPISHLTKSSLNLGDAGLRADHLKQSEEVEEEDDDDSDLEPTLTANRFSLLS